MKYKWFVTISCYMEERIDCPLKCYDYIVKKAKNGGNSARVFVPKSWREKRVAVLLLEKVGEE